MFGIGEKKVAGQKMVTNPELGFSIKIVYAVAVVIVLIGIRFGAIGGAISAVIAYLFYNTAIKAIAQMKKVEPYIKDPTTKEQIGDIAKEKAKNKRLNKILLYSLIAFALVFGFIFLMSTLSRK